MPSHVGQAVSVSAVAKFLYSVISQNITPLWIKGEISNFKCQQNGNAYFSIKDAESKLNAIIMVNSNARKTVPDLKNGLEILIFGKISYYKKEGTVTVFVEEIEFVGEGILKQKFDELKNKLEQEGLFLSEHKKKIPLFPRWVGVVTSPTGAAIQDILNVMNRRFGSVNIVVFPASVQGEGASKEISEAIRVANRFAGNFLDVLIVGRGGGSIEDLWCFNEEAVARAIYSSKIPIISAVGHEIDYTIADYVADLRAPTPSAAAEIVVPDRNEIKKNLTNLSIRMDTVIQNKVDWYRRTLDIKGLEYFKRFIQGFLSDYRMSLENFRVRFYSYFSNLLNSLKSSLLLQQEKLKAFNPKNILNRGYSITYKRQPDGSKKHVFSVADITKGDNIDTLLNDGEINSIVQ